MKSKTSAVTMTAMSRLTMLHGQRREHVAHDFAAVDRGLEVFEDLALAQQRADVDVRRVKEDADRLAVDAVALLLELAQRPVRDHELRVTVVAQVRHRARERARGFLEDLEQLDHRLRR